MASLIHKCDDAQAYEYHSLATKKITWLSDGQVAYLCSACCDLMITSYLKHEIEDPYKVEEC